MARVSVIIPTYNCGLYIGRALESVFAQTYRDFEVIVVDDGSTDETSNAIAPWLERIQYIRVPNGGVSAARNLALARAAGEFSAFLDADDFWLPDKLAAQVAYMDAMPSCALLHGDVSVVDEQGVVLFERFDVAHDRPVLSGACLHELLRSSSVNMPTVLERRSCHESVGNFDTDLHYAEDYLRWLRIAAEGYEFGYLQEPLAAYRWRQGSASRDAKHIVWSESLLHVYARMQEVLKSRSEPDDTAMAIVSEQIDGLHMDLIYRHRCAGRNAQARQQSVDFSRHNPRSLRPYVEWIKSWAPSKLRAAVVNAQTTTTD